MKRKFVCLELRALPWNYTRGLSFGCWKFSEEEEEEEEVGVACNSCFDFGLCGNWVSVKQLVCGNGWEKCN